MANENRMPTLFLAHGSPMNIIERNTFTEALSVLSGSLPHPTGIIVISVHWQTRGTQVTCIRNPRIMHDLGGFPDELYHIGYPCPDSPERAERVRAALGLGVVSCDMERGLDNGAWSVLHHMCPLAFIPVIQISLNVFLIPEERMELGKRLSPLRDEGILILGSGNVVRNLGLVTLRMSRLPHTRGRSRLTAGLRGASNMATLRN
jgi:4,5-DOPA dioxygenase extradiol